MRLRTIGAVLLAIFLAGLNTAIAQERYGSIAGTIMDSSQAPVPGATVTATNAATGATRIAVSTADGTFRLPDLDPGRYSVTVELPGFQKVQASDVLVLLGRAVDFSPKLQVGGVSEVGQCLR